jgi:LytR cell envelope-related transcriptional attenuator
MTFTRVRALIFVSVLFITAMVAVGMAIGRDSQANPVAVETCPSGLVPAKIKMPEHNIDVVLNIYNGTKTVGLAQKVGEDFKNRGFKVKKMASAPGNKISNEIAEITFGPEAYGAGWLVSAYFLVDSAKLIFDIRRKGAEVDVLIGTQYQQLATTTEVNQSIAALGNPSLPDGTCEAKT